MSYSHSTRRILGLLVATSLAFAFAGAAEAAKRAKRYGIEAKLLEYDDARDVFKIKVMQTKVSSGVGGSTAGAKAPKAVKRGSEQEFKVVPEGSVLRRTVIKSIRGGGLDNSGTRDGFKKAVKMLPEDRPVVVSFEKNPGHEQNPEEPEFIIKLIQIRMTEAELQARFEEISSEE